MKKLYQKNILNEKLFDAEIVDSKDTTPNCCIHHTKDGINYKALDFSMIDNDGKPSNFDDIKAMDLTKLNGLFYM